MTDFPKHLLLVDDEEALREVVAERLAEHGFVVEQAASGEQAMEKLAGFAFDILLTDLRLPGIGGREVLAAALDRYPDLIAIIITGYGTVKDAVAAIKQGAADFISKPFQFDELLHVIESVVEQRRLRSENAYLRAQLEERYRLDGIIGRSRAMRDLFQLLETVAHSSSTVLITGETGTGKELAAKAIHHNSPRRTQRFVAINCSAIPETLLEAELFGHVRGAFTGAVATRQGRIEQAHKGTLFLDEIGTMSAALQAKLLRVLQEREVERLGDSHPIRVDVRVIAATNSDLRRLVAEGSFREDLYYRLNVIPVHVPALRERREDIPLLVRHFVAEFCREQVPPRTPPAFSQDAMRHLMAYSWPGNVRQLENTVERAIALTPGRAQIDLADLPAEVQQVAETEEPRAWFPDGGVDLEAHISAIELALIRESLERTGGNKRRAAELLNIKRTTLVEKLKRLERSTPDA
ncbi:MAG TPA: sigma-54 dependent transcriptional regulator [Vicinamibacterales bacterium]|nr:sigma-54 dependent transcriptional regulator [Vicinamibacterales bacterium]